jgi:hypothetical protein
MFTSFHQYLREKGSFPSVNRRAVSRVQRNVEEDEGIVDNAQKIHALVQEECLRASVLGASVCRPSTTSVLYPAHSVF